ADESFLTNEDTALYAKPVQTLTLTNGAVSTFAMTSQAANGVVSEYNSKDGSFKYMPNLSYVGGDTFEYAENNADKTGAVTRKISITIQPVNLKPWLDNQIFNFPMNSVDNIMIMTAKDKKDLNPKVLLDLKGFVSQVNSLYGVVKKIAPGQFTYTPQSFFRGIDKVNVFVVNAAGLYIQQSVTINVGNPFLNLEPALAVRAPACMNCHSNVSSRFITDFGKGDAYFFGKPGNPFTSAPTDFYGDHAKSWQTSTFESTVYVPKVDLGIDLTKFEGADFKGDENVAKTVSEYVRIIESKKAVPAMVFEKSIYIAAPNANLLNTRTGGSGSAGYRFVKDNVNTSPELSGLIDRGAYLEASSLTCDGDLILSKTLHLKNLTLKTNSGCRVYSTQSIFVQGPVNYEKLIANSTDNTNLQLVSTRWVNLGVGDSHCEVEKTNPGWYSQDSDTLAKKPDELRLLNYGGPTRTAANLDDAKALNESMIAELRKISPAFEDASCRAPIAGLTPREVHFERLLINAPRVDSRYTGKFTGVIVAEIPLMSLSKFSFSYDAVFNRVSVLPLMKAEDFLIVK
ncbi:MAG: Ig-like domain-containing protein, partial [Bdellovibrionaceae bacterium]|nr:Ig-like domain-containing protein [Pseudobdellovibrionaceae bacterium]